jgi:hypothetical protein
MLKITLSFINDARSATSDHGKSTKERHMVQTAANVAGGSKAAVSTRAGRVHYAPESDRIAALR